MAGVVWCMRYHEIETETANVAINYCRLFINRAFCV